jgi:predicted DNA binding protein
MMEVVLRIRMPDNWVKDIGKEFSTPIQFIECIPHGKFGGRGLIKIDACNELNDKIVEAIKNHPDVCKVEISPVKNGGLLGSIVTDKCVACRALASSDCFMTDALSLGDGRVEWRLITGGDGSLSELLKTLEASGCEIELKSKTSLSNKSLLTTRQEEIIRLAFEKGYYDYPKKTSMKELAKLFNISQSTLAEIIQRGERKVMEQQFGKKF